MAGRTDRMADREFICDYFLRAGASGSNVLLRTGVYFATVKFVVMRRKIRVLPMKTSGVFFSRSQLHLRRSTKWVPEIRG
jgi:hypothetical protein